MSQVWRAELRSSETIGEEEEETELRTRTTWFPFLLVPALLLHTCPQTSGSAWIHELGTINPYLWPSTYSPNRQNATCCPQHRAGSVPAGEQWSDPCQPILLLTNSPEGLHRWRALWGTSSQAAGCGVCTSFHTVWTPWSSQRRTLQGECNQEEDLPWEGTESLALTGMDE